MTIILRQGARIIAALQKMRQCMTDEENEEFDQLRTERHRLTLESRPWEIWVGERS